jgi:transcription initiation factor TFIID TATA-box-binding protein
VTNITQPARCKQMAPKKPRLAPDAEYKPYRIAIRPAPAAGTIAKKTSRRGWQAMSDEEVFRICFDSITTTNFVATGKLNVSSINVEEIAKRHPGAIFYVFRFAALINRLTWPRTACSVYPTGMVACMGAKTQTEAVLALHKYVAILNIQGVPCRLVNLKIDNVVSSVLTFPVDLNMLLQKWGHVVKYEHENFPGATLDCSGLPIDPPTKIVMEIFESGKINITGARTRAEVERVYPYVHHNILVVIRIHPDATTAAAPQRAAPAVVRAMPLHNTRTAAERPEEDEEGEEEEEEPEEADGPAPTYGDLDDDQMMSMFIQAHDDYDLEEAINNINRELRR